MKQAMVCGRPRVATWLLQRFAISDSAIGDLIERYGRRPSPLWFWRQTLTTIAVRVAHNIWTDKWTVVRAILIGWALLSVFSSIPLSRRLLNLTVAWEIDAVRVWWISLGGFALWLPTLVYGLVTGYLIAGVHPGKSMTTVFAVASSLALASVPLYLAWAQRALSGGVSEMGMVFHLYAQLWVFLSAAGVLVGGLAGARRGDGQLGLFA